MERRRAKIVRKLCIGQSQKGATAKAHESASKKRQFFFFSPSLITIWKNSFLPLVLQNILTGLVRPYRVVFVRFVFGG